MHLSAFARVKTKEKAKHQGQEDQGGDAFFFKNRKESRNR